MTETEIAEKLNVDQSTISRDIRALKEMSQQFVFDLEGPTGREVISLQKEDSLLVFEYNREAKKVSAILGTLKD